LNLRSSLHNDQISVSGNGAWDMISDISEQDYELSAIDSIYRLSLLTMDSCRFVATQFMAMTGIASYCIDLIVDSDSGHIYAIDLNDAPSLKLPANDIERVVADYWNAYKKSPGTI
jgi:hypothetical protein